MVESISELRRKVQGPVRRYNDIAGLLIGDRVSIHITRLFIARGWSPTIATFSMLACGLAGSALLAFGDRAAVAGFALLVLYYVFDCVDGEVARYHGIEKVFWSFHDYLFHLYVKSACFLALGFAAFATTGRSWMLAVAWVAFTAVLCTKVLRDLSFLLANRLVLLRGPEADEAAYEQFTEGVEDRDLEDTAPAPGSEDPESYGGVLSTTRSILTNFDLVCVVFLALAIADVFLGDFVFLGMPVDLKVLFFLGVSALLALDFLDRLFHHVRTSQLFRETRTLLVRAHHFRIRRR